MKIKLLIFDLDGTLVDSRYDLADAVNHAMKNLGCNTISYENIPQVIGGGSKQMVKDVMGNCFSEKLDYAFDLFLKYYKENHKTKTDYYGGVPEMLAQFSDTKKVIFSNKPHEFTVSIAEKFGWDREFDLVLGAKSGKRKKPHPDVFYTILNHFGIKPENALMIGDTKNDILGGKAAGLKTCAVTYGYRSKQQLENFNPDFFIDNMRELINLI